MRVSAPHVKKEKFGTDIEVDIEAPFDIPSEGQLDELDDVVDEFIRERFFDAEPYVGDYEFDDDCDDCDWEDEVIEIDDDRE